MRAAFKAQLRESGAVDEAARMTWRELARHPTPPARRPALHVPRRARAISPPCMIT